MQLYIGQGDYRVGEKGAWSDPAQLDRQLTLNDQYGVQGSVHFSAKQIRADRLGAVTRYRDHHYAAPALLPLMAQLPADAAGGAAAGRRRAATAGGRWSSTWQAGTGAGGPVELGALPGRRRRRDAGRHRPGRQPGRRPGAAGRAPAPTA